MQNKKTWKRIDTISKLDETRIENVVNKTSGMSKYGNRVRSSIMLPIEIAEYISDISETDKITVSEVIIQIISKSMGIK